MLSRECGGEMSFNVFLTGKFSILREISFLAKLLLYCSEIEKAEHEVHFCVGSAQLLGIKLNQIKNKFLVSCLLQNNLLGFVIWFEIGKPSDNTNHENKLYLYS